MKRFRILLSAAAVALVLLTVFTSNASAQFGGIVVDPGSTLGRNTIYFLNYACELKFGMWFIFDVTDAKAPELVAVISGREDPIAYIVKYLLPADGSVEGAGSTGGDGPILMR